MRADENSLLEFISPYYADKDIMHNMWHIKLMLKAVNKVISLGKYEIDRECLVLATYFHGFVYRDEPAIRSWMHAKGYENKYIDAVIKVALESQRPEVPTTLEGKILHDAHVLEGGRTYLVVKTLITGSVRGQSLEQTMDFMRDHVLSANHCYLPETIPLCEDMNRFTEIFYKELIENIYE